MLRWSLSLFSMLALACGQVKTVNDDAGPDAGVADAPGVDAPTDAPVDAAPPPPPPPGTARELTVTAGAVGDSRFRMEVELGGGFSPTPAANGAVTFDTATTITLHPGGN